MDPVLAVRLRRQWPLFAAALLFALFMLVHTLVFQPRATHYRRVIAQAAAMGLILDPAHPAAQPLIPLRVFTLLSGNSVTPAEAEARSQSGTLGAELVQTLSTLAGRHGLEVVVAEPGPLTQQPGSLEVRAHLRLRGSYTGFVSLVDDLSRGERLWVIERFTISPGTPGRNDIELWMGGCLLKRNGTGS